MILAKPVLMQDWASYFQNAIYNVLLVTLIWRLYITLQLHVTVYMEKYITYYLKQNVQMSNSRVQIRSVLGGLGFILRLVSLTHFTKNW